MALTLIRYFVVPVTVLLALENSFVGAANLGVCYSRSGGNEPSPAEAVRLYQTYKIGRMRIYEPDHDILEALKGSTIQLTVGIPNIEVGTIATSQVAAFRWFEDHIRPYARHVRLRYIVVGRNVNLNAGDAQVVLQAMKNLDAIINENYRMHIKITTEVNFLLVEKMIPPHESYFNSSTTRSVGPIVRFLVARDAPLFVHLFPYFVRYGQDGADDEMREYFTSKSAAADFVRVAVDSFYVALETVGGRNVRVVVGETGWPSAGGEGASAELTKEFVWTLAEHALSTWGTPVRPGRQMEVYVYELFNGNAKRAGVHLDFGMFDANMKPVYGVPPMK